MFKKMLVLVIVFGFCIGNVTAEQITVSWDGEGDGESWSDPCNWNPDIVPDNDGDTYIVTIDSNSIGATEINVHLQQNRTIDQLDCYGDVELLCWPSCGIQLTIDPCDLNPNDLTNHGTLNIDDGFWVAGNIRNYGQLEIEAEAEVYGDITNYNEMQISGGVEIVGNVTNSCGATALIEDAGIEGDWYNDCNSILKIEDNADIWEGDLENVGSVMVKLGGDLWAEQQFHNAGQIQLMGGSLGRWQWITGEGIIDNDSNGVISGFGTVEAKQSIQNKGTIFASSGSLLLYSEGSITNTGTLRNDAGATLHIHPFATEVNNQGTIESNANGSVVFNCNLSNDPNAIIRLHDGTLAAGKITQKAGAEFEGFGGVTGDVYIKPDGLIELTGPTNVFGDVEIDDGATLEVSDGTTIITGHTMCNNGTIHMIGGRVICQGGLTNNGCDIIWEPGIDSNAADYNLDGRVNLEDYAQFAKTWLWEASWQ